MLSTCLNVLCVDFNMWVALAHLLSLGYRIVRRAIIILVRIFTFPNDFFRQFPKEGHHGLFQDIRVKTVDKFCGKVRDAGYATSPTHILLLLLFLPKILSIATLSVFSGAYHCYL